MEKKLYRDSKNGPIGGVCYGIAKYLNIDVVVVRIIWLVLVFCVGTGLLAYLICWIVLPDINSDMIE